MSETPPLQQAATGLPPNGEILEVVTRHIGAGLAVISRDYTVLWTNKVLEDLYGDTVGKTCYRTYQKQEGVCSWCGVSEIFGQGSERVVREVSSHDKDGNLLQLEIIATPIRDAHGNISAALELVLPITEQKQKEKSLAELLTFSQSLVTTADLPKLFRKVTTLSKELLHLDFSTLMLTSDDKKALVIRDTLGFPEETIGHYALLEGQGLSTHVVHEKKPAVVVDFQTETRFEIPSLVVEKHIRSALCVPMMLGEEVFGVLIGHTLQPRVFKEDTISIYQSFANQAAVAIKNAMHMHSLHASEKKFRTLFDNTNDAILIYNLDCSLVEVNQATCKRLGYSREELLALPITRFIAQPYASLAKERVKQVKKTGMAIFESAHIKKDGSIFPIEQSCSLIDFDAQTVILCVARDISQRKNRDQERLRTQKLESLGVLAGGIAHDFNNLLSGILGNISLAKASLPQAGEVAERLIDTEKAALRAKNLTQQLLTFARGGAPIKTKASLTEIIQDAAGFAVRGTKTVCEYDFADTLWLAEVDTGQLGQVLQNLAINAVHAMPEGGTIRIAARNVTVNPDELPLTPGKYALITVRDHGIGIPPEHLAQIFDPYFTTKQSSSGLGLAVVYSIIANHGGHITVQSEAGKGTLFSIYLPSTGKKPPVEKAVETQAPLTKGSGKILVMDDEELIRNVSMAMLTKLGYEPHTASDGEETITRYLQAQKDGQPFDLVIMDLTVPGGMGGKEAISHLRKLDPQIRAVVSSGYATDPIMANFSEYGFCGVAPKPFSLQDLSKLLQTILGS
ncbi:MAG: PAS domain S-box protein [Proteobacteria bacterium]|nr:PAS domain S-box protein [Pseudomonadota bacterium]